MAFNIHQINEEIKVNLRSFCAITGITDLTMVVTDPDDISSSSVVLSEIGNGLYETTFTPVKKGRYYIKISSISEPKNGYAESYYVDEIPHITTDSQNINRMMVDTNIGDMGNSISTGNSRPASTLASGAVFQGVGEEVTKYGRAGVSINTDNVTDGVLTIEVSHDNIKWLPADRAFPDTTFTFPKMWNIVEPYFRIKYTNGTTEAINLIITTQYSNNADIVLGHELNAVLPSNTEAQPVRPTNTFDLDSARVHILGQRSDSFFGFNSTVGGQFEDVHPSGGDINWQTTAKSIEILSTSSADSSAGLGLQSVKVHGLSATGEDQSEIIITNGLTPVAGVLTYIRINKLHSVGCGTYGGSHQGDIICQVSGGGALLSMMSGAEGLVNSSVKYGSGEAGNGYWTVPLGKVMYITRLHVIPDSSTSKTMDVILYEREGILETSVPFCPRRTLYQERGINTSITKVFKSHKRVNSLSDIWFRAKTSEEGSSDLSSDILGTSAFFTVLSSSGAISNSGTLIIEGDLGTDAGAITGVLPDNVSGTIHNANSTTAQAKTDLTSGYNALNAMAGTSVHGGAYGAGEILTPNVYTTAGASTMSGTLTLDAGGDPTAIFVFKLASTFVLDPNTIISLIGGTKPENVYFLSGGALTIGATNALLGRFIAIGAITVGANVNINGGLYSLPGAIAMAGGSIVTAFTDPSLIEVSLDFYLVDADASGA